MRMSWHFIALSGVLLFGTAGAAEAVKLDPEVLKKIDASVGKLNAEEFAVRESASVELAGLDSAYVPALKEKADQAGSAEVRERLLSVIAKLSRKVEHGEIQDGLQADLHALRDSYFEDEEIAFKFDVTNADKEPRSVRPPASTAFKYPPEGHSVSDGADVLLTVRRTSGGGLSHGATQYGREKLPPVTLKPGEAVGMSFVFLAPNKEAKPGNRLAQLKAIETAVKEGKELREHVPFTLTPGTYEIQALYFGDDKLPDGLKSNVATITVVTGAKKK